MPICINVSVSNANILACINPTKTSIIINGNGKKNGTINATISSKTSPANTFPNNLNEKDKTLTLSEIISKNPSINLIGFEKLINLFRNPLIPSDFNERSCINKTETIASAKVAVKSLFGDLRRGISSFPILIITDPKKPGNKAIKFALNIKIKKVVTIGKTAKLF